MSEAAARFRQPIDLDEFERRLRAGAISSDPAGPAAKSSEDPLAELARLVGQDDPFRSAPVPPQLRPAAVARGSDLGPVPHLQQVHPPLDRVDPPFGGPELSAHHTHDEALIYQLPRPALVASGEATAVEGDGYADYAGHHVQGSADAAPEVPPAAVIAAADAPRRSWRGVVILSAVLATGFAGLAAALTMKGSSSLSSSSSVDSASNGPPVILAGGPTKIQPPKSAADTPDDPPSVLDKAAATKPVKTKLVDNVEQPVDLSQQPTTSRPGSSTAMGSSSAPAVGSGLDGQKRQDRVASLDPAVTSAAALDSRPETRAASSGTDNHGAAALGQNGFPAPKRVKIVSVRPDGSIIGNDPDAAPAATAPAAVAAAPDEPPQIELGVAMPSAADPTAPQPARGPSVASQSRSDGRSVGDTPAPDRDRKDPVAALIDPTGGERTASTKVAGGGGAPGTAAAPKSKHAKKNVEVADLGSQNKESPKASDGEGGFSAQLAASPTESAAKATLRKLNKKYGSSFTGHKLTYRRVKVEGKTVYRVRLTGLTKDDANSICGKLQSDGGTCFIANN